MTENDKPRRGVIEILILTLTAMVAVFIVSATVIIVVSELKDPKIDTSVITNRLSDIVTAVLVALLALIAGRSEPRG
jgi:succinate dehydrogenase hydrophobic anchor subunit